CAEAVWWRCHRRIIADHLLAHGHAVVHLMGVGQSQPGHMTHGAQIVGDRVVYPAPSLAEDRDSTIPLPPGESGR
ncbi:MAG TPA: hypothetical protein VLZ53_07135, partial [Devosia sp.]|nr:hypothetical protein [Devosia sp.]